MPFEKLYNKMLFTWELSQRVKFVQYINGIISKSDFINTCIGRVWVIRLQSDPN
jgi:hypothetical protein